MEHGTYTNTPKWFHLIFTECTVHDKKAAYPAFPISLPILPLMKDVFSFGNEDLIRLISTFTLILPIAAILIKRSMWHSSMATLFIYYTQFFFFSLVNDGFLALPGKPGSLDTFSHIIFDLPLLLLFTQYFAEDPQIRKKIRYALMSWIGLGVFLTLLIGLSEKTINILMGPGLFLADVISLTFFIKYIHAGIQQRSENGKAFMAGSLAFLYGSYTLIFLFRFVLGSGVEQDTYILFELTTIVSAVLMAIGIMLNQKKMEVMSEIRRGRQITIQNWEDFQFK